MAGNLHLAPDRRDLALGVDQIGRPLHPHVGAAVHRLLHPHPIGLERRLALVGAQLDPERVFRAELLVRLHPVGRNADHHGAALLELRQQLGEGDRLLGAAGRVVLGIEIDHHRTALEGGEAEVFALVGGEIEVGSEIADGKGHFAFLSSC